MLPVVLPRGLLRVCAFLDIWDTQNVHSLENMDNNLNFRYSSCSGGMDDFNPYSIGNEGEEEEDGGDNRSDGEWGRGIGGKGVAKGPNHAPVEHRSSLSATESPRLRRTPRR